MRKHLDIALDALIPHYEIRHPVLWDECFHEKKPVEVEIGAGLGEFLVKKSQENPDTNFIAIEQQWKRAKRILRKVKVARQQHEGFEDNLRVLRADATIVFERFFSPSVIRKVFCLFPCPWPKKKHIKYRLFSRDFFRLANSRLIKKGEMIIVTDFLPYFEWMKEEVEGCGFQTKTRIVKPQFDTKFERKWCAQGKKEFYELHLVKTRHIAVAVKKDVSLKNYFVKNFIPERFSFTNKKGETSIVLKEFLFDPENNKAMVRLLVSEKNISQHLWVMIAKQKARWRVSKAEGHPILPTEGVTAALESVFKEVNKTVF